MVCFSNQHSLSLQGFIWADEAIQLQIWYYLSSWCRQKAGIGSVSCALAAGRSTSGVLICSLLVFGSGIDDLITTNKVFFSWASAPLGNCSERGGSSAVMWSVLGWLLAPLCSFGYLKCCRCAGCWDSLLFYHFLVLKIVVRHTDCIYRGPLVLGEEKNAFNSIVKCWVWMRCITVLM